jgi:hypothetical protein
MVILAMAAVVWPNLGNRNSSTRLAMTANGLASLLKLARSGAMCTSSTYRCVFETGRMFAVIESETDPVKAPGVFEPIEAHWSKLDMGKDEIRCLAVEFDEWESSLKKQEADLLENDNQDEETEDSPPIMFYPDGTSDSATIVIGDKSDHCMTLMLNGLTGQVDLINGNKLDEETTEKTKSKSKSQLQSK